MRNATTVMSMGTPSTTTSPSGNDALRRMTVTVMIATTAPMPRARMSTELPMWLMSEVPMLTTSPVATRLGRVAPMVPACRTVS